MTDPLGDLVGHDPVGARQDRGELVAAVAIEPVAVAGAGHRVGHDVSRQSPAGWPIVSLKTLNASRSSISTANGSRASTASPSSRWNAPWLRSPVRASCSARTRTAPWASAFWRAIDAWLANSLVSSNSLALNAAVSPIRPMLSVPIVSPSTTSGTTIIDSGSNGVPGTWTDRGSRWAWLERTASRGR